MEMNNLSNKAEELEGITTTFFNMASLSAHQPPPKRKGLSRYFSDKSRSFTCLADVKSTNDLKKAPIPEAKRRKYSDRLLHNSSLFASHGFLQEQR